MKTKEFTCYFSDTTTSTLLAKDRTHAYLSFKELHPSKTIVNLTLKAQW